MLSDLYLKLGVKLGNLGFAALEPGFSQGNTSRLKPVASEGTSSNAWLSIPQTENLFSKP